MREPPSALAGESEACPLYTGLPDASKTCLGGAEGRGNPDDFRSCIISSFRATSFWRDLTRSSSCETYLWRPEMYIRANPSAFVLYSPGQTLLKRLGSIPYSAHAAMLIFYILSFPISYFFEETSSYNSASIILETRSGNFSSNHRTVFGSSRKHS